MNNILYYPVILNKTNTSKNWNNWTDCKTYYPVFILWKKVKPIRDTNKKTWPSYSDKWTLSSACLHIIVGMLSLLKTLELIWHRSLSCSIPSYYLVLCLSYLVLTLKNRFRKATTSQTRPMNLSVRLLHVIHVQYRFVGDTAFLFSVSLLCLQSTFHNRMLHRCAFNVCAVTGYSAFFSE